MPAPSPERMRADSIVLSTIKVIAERVNPEATTLNSFARQLNLGNQTYIQVCLRPQNTLHIVIARRERYFLRSCNTLVVDVSLKVCG